MTENTDEGDIKQHLGLQLGCCLIKLLEVTKLQSHLGPIFVHLTGPKEHAWSFFKQEKKTCGRQIIFVITTVAIKAGVHRCFLLKLCWCPSMGHRHLKIMMREAAAKLPKEKSIATSFNQWDMTFGSWFYQFQWILAIERQFKGRKHT